MPHQGKKVDEGCSRRARLDGEGGCSVGWRESVKHAYEREKEN